MTPSLKDQLRQEMHQRRAAFAVSMDPAVIQEKFLFNLLNIFKIHTITPPASIALYNAIGDEAPTGLLIQKLFDLGFQIYLPRMGEVTGLAPLEFQSFIPGDDLIKGPFGTMEPKPSSANSFIPDVIICPCLAFSPDKHRLGYGKGFYDRTLHGILDSKRAPKPLLLGLAFACQETPAIFFDPHDISMDTIVTEY